MADPSNKDARQGQRWSWPRRSTRAFLDEAGRTPGFTWFDRLHGYVYLRWPYLYIGIATGEHPLTRWIRPLVNLIGRFYHPADEPDGKAGFADQYHGKVVPTAAARQLVTVKEEVRLEDLEQIIPYRTARDIILQNPDHLAALECPCRAARENPCLPLDVCLIVGEPFVGLVLDHHPRRARQITPEEACAILEAENARGHVHHAFFKDAMLDRFYAICNCCSCCCGAMQAWQNGTPMLASSGYRAVVDVDACAGCGECVEICPFGTVAMPEITAQIDPEICMGCGVCVTACSTGTLSLLRDERQGEPLEIQRLIAALE